jgi:hypothetical protein
MGALEDIEANIVKPECKVQNAVSSQGHSVTWRRLDAFATGGDCGMKVSLLSTGQGQHRIRIGVGGIVLDGFETDLYAKLYPAAVPSPLEGGPVEETQFAPRF